MASKCTKCGNTENYNFALNIGLCNLCIGERLEELKIENAKLNIILYHRENGLSHPDFNAEIEISKQAERIEELETENKKLKALKCPPIESGDSCICPIEELETELTEANKQLDNARDYLWGRKANYVKNLEAKNDKLEKALVLIDNWAKAYPLDVFPKPDLERAAKVLKAAGMTLDAISGDTMRHVIEGVKDITNKALNS